MKKILIGIMIILLTGCSFGDLFIKKNISKEYLKGTHYVLMEVKNYGKITLKLNADKAPITVTNFINLVNSNFYDGLTIHRIMKGFMMQGGDPTGTGYYGSDETIKGEFIANGVSNDILHKRGVISMARSESSYDSASSQFFIMQEDNSNLDNYYAAFGHVIEGMDVVDKICNIASPIDDNGTISANEQPIIEYIKVIEHN